MSLSSYNLYTSID